MNCCTHGCREGRDCPAREKAAAEFADMPITMIEPEPGTMADAVGMVLALIVAVATMVMVCAGIAFVYVNWPLIVAAVSH